jgi:hypothetical protein
MYYIRYAINQFFKGINIICNKKAIYIDAFFVSEY